LAQFGSSPSGGGERGQFADLLTRHAVHLPSGERCSHGAVSPCCGHWDGRLDTARRLQEGGGEDRNRTYLATCAATTVLKTARATRHPSLSQKKKTSNVQRPTSNVEVEAPGGVVAFPSWEVDSFPDRRIGDYLSFLIALTISSKSGQSPVSSLEWSNLPLARISKAPPLEGISVSDLMRSPSSRILAAKLTAFGV